MSTPQTAPQATYPPLTAQARDLAATIADQAQALADDTLIGPKHAAVAGLIANVQLLQAWVPDDRKP